MSAAKKLGEARLGMLAPPFSGFQLRDGTVSGCFP
jgi:hypothetical protein